MKYTIKSAFTLAEVLITLVVIGVIAAITMPILTAQYKEQETVSKVKKMYSIISQAVMEYQFENHCTEDFADCIEADDYWNSKTFYKRFDKKLNYAYAVYYGESLDKISSLLPKTAKNIDGTNISNRWDGVRNSGDSAYNTIYIMNDGVVMSIELPDSNRKSAFLFFDVNGVKGPNRIGKDQFPIGIGARNNEKYKSGVHPYYNEDDYTSPGGLCNIANNHECSPDICTKNNCSPTAYVLKYGKLPPL